MHQVHKLSHSSKALPADPSIVIDCAINEVVLY